ncbi:MAG TPA: tetratricopeptide repeat-containing glycosyltransferase family protein [Caulobacteraceae bacterium]|nr:tetratricopeptide repeat-containing glycosyltransferase family protein [Caulobacteraceae bacterium]
MPTKTVIDEGLAHHQAGHLEAAAACYAEALRQDPDLFDALHMLGVLRVQTGRPDEGAALIARAIDLSPGVAAAHANLAAALRLLGRREEALASLERALALDPDQARVQFDRATLLVELGRLDAALAGFDEALAIAPNFMEAHNDRGGALMALERPVEALASFESAIALSPDAAEPHSNRAAALNALDRPEDAIGVCEQAITLAPGHAGAHHNLGTALLKLDRPAEALARFDEAIALAHDLADARNGRGLALHALRRPEEALASYDAALALRPDDPQTHFNRAAARLALGDLPGGFDDYRWRWRLPGARLRLPELPCPLWAGEDLTGKAILVHGEQGFGDALQFVRYASPLASKAARVTLRVDPALERLFRSVPGVDVATSYDPAAYDFHIPLMDLPRVVGTTLATIPGATPYLVADPADVAAWSGRLGALGPGRRVGLVWAGKSRAHDPAAFAIDKRRSLRLAQLAPLATTPGVRFYSLQKGEPAAEAAEPPPCLDLVDLTPELADFADTAALIQNLDLVISVDTSVAHLAGALGKPVWVLSRFDGCWRWLNGREDSPWYPTARVFHQRIRGDWEEVIARVAEELSRGH